LTLRAPSRKLIKREENMKHESEQFPLLLPATLPPVAITSAASASCFAKPVTNGNTPMAADVMVTAPVVVAEKKHHRYGPSRMGYLDECAGFTSRSGTNAAAEDGTALHERMEAILQLVIAGTAKTACQGLNIYASQYDLTDEERDYLRFCCVRCDVYIVKNPLKIYTEINVVVSDESGKQLNHGTLDVVFVWAEVAIIQDFKFGWVPVKHATKNLQGMNYALGVFQKFTNLRAVGVEFDQPKLGWFSTTSYKRTQIGEMYRRLADVIASAEFVQNNPTHSDVQKLMKPGAYCDYCSLSGSCAVLSNYRAVAATKFNDLPEPVSFKGLSINTPQEIALARYWVDIIEAGVKEIKQRAFELAELNGGEIACTLPNGEEIVYSIAEKNADRSLGSAIEISEALKEFITLEEVLGAADLALGRLEKIATDALVDSAKARGEKLTKKAAWQNIQSTLEAHDLLTRPDGKIRFLKRKKQAPTEPKQIEQQTKE
jgi:uncharacterized protein DUF2800